MENMGDLEHKSLINELTQGKEMAKQLQVHLNVPSSSQETREMLVQKILASYEKALSMLSLNSSQVAGDQPRLGIGVSESPSSLDGSPRSEDSDRDEHKDGSRRKRKSMPRWTQQVRVCPGMALEGLLHDGYSWRKYGQKDILGARYPRGYYRCTHRHVQGCLATKQVQRSDEDPSIFEITYRGRHTCIQAPNMQAAASPQLPPENQEPSNHLFDPQQQQQQQSQELLLNFRSGLRVITEDLDSMEQQQSFPSFQFPSTSNVNQVFSPSLVDNSFMGHFSPSFVSPSSTSGTNYFSLSSTQTGMQNSESGQLNEVINSATTSATNSPTVGLDFPLGNMEFYPNFSFSNPGFQS